MLGNPFQERILRHNFHLLTSFLIQEHIPAAALLQFGGVENVLASVAILQDPAGDFQILKDNESLNSAKFQGLQSVLNTIADLAGVLANLLEVLIDKFLLLDEFDVAESLGGQLNGLVEAVLTTVGDVNDFDDLGLQTVVEHVGGIQIVLEIGGTSQDNAGDVDLIGSDEVLHRQFGDLSHIIVPLLLTETGETEGRLTTTTVLLGKIDRKLVNYFTGISAEGSEKSTVTVHDDKAKFLIGLEEFSKGLSVELVVAKVQGGVDGLERLEIDVDLSFLAFLGQDFTTVHNQTVRGDLVVQLETLLGGGNSGQDRLSVDTRLDVGCRTLQMILVSSIWFSGLGIRTYSSANILAARETWSLGADNGQCAVSTVGRTDDSRIINEIMEVPFPLAASRRLMSFLTFQISIYCPRC